MLNQCTFIGNLGADPEVRSFTNGGRVLQAGTLSPFALVGEVRKFFQGPVALSGAIATGDAVLAAQAMGADRRRGPPREGPALLQGLVLCGRCGTRMTVQYRGHTQGTVTPRLRLPERGHQACSVHLPARARRRHRPRHCRSAGPHPGRARLHPQGKRPLCLRPMRGPDHKRPGLPRAGMPEPNPRVQGMQRARAAPWRWPTCAATTAPPDSSASRSRSPTPARTPGPSSSSAASTAAPY